jgi:hypothetical protein
MSNWNDYLNRYKDVAKYIDDARLPGIDTGTSYTTAYNKSTKGWEDAWISRTNQRLGTNKKDASDFSREQLAETHYENWGKNENRTDPTSGVDMNQFQQLLDRLEGSKKRQVRQKSVEDRRGTFAQGIAGMMSNF